MQLTLIRLDDDGEATLGALLVDGKYFSHILEDEYRKEKVKGETRIPSGNYEIKLRTVGGLHEKYKAKYPEWHRGMLWLQDVPNFKWIYIHPGNKDEHTDGCLLPGWNHNKFGDEGKHFVGNSVMAYAALYTKIMAAMDAVEKVFINIIDFDRAGKEKE